jgi:hypothetical protein
MGFLNQMFEKFFEFNNNFEYEFNWFRHNYPLTFYVFNKDLRSFFSGGISNDEVKYWKCLLIFICQPFYRLILKVCFSISRPKYIYNLRWNKRLDLGFREYCQVCLGNPNIGRIRPHLLGFCPVEYREFHKILKMGSLSELKNASVRLRDIETRLERQRARLVGLFGVCDARALLLGGHSSAASALLISVCEQLGVHTVSFAHGIVQNPRLITVFPLYCSSFVVWSETQKMCIGEKLSVADVGKLVYCGSVNPINRFAHGKGVLREQFVVMILPPLSKLRQFNESKAVLARLSNQLIRHNLIFRWHPRDSKRDVLNWFSGFWVKNGKKPVVSRDDSLLFSASVILSLGSTLLYQLQEAGCCCAQVSNEFFPRIEGVIELSLELVSDDGLLELMLRPRPAVCRTKFNWGGVMMRVLEKK